MSSVVVTELNHVAYVKLHRPEVRNAFNPEMIAELTQIFQGFEKRSDLRWLPWMCAYS
ncbi:MAG: enoyl-CoA hydratase-related protein, partial [Bdellovibrio sp.]